MTDKQFEQAQKELREEMESLGYGWINVKYIKPPEEYEVRKEELSCISMINSILAYHWYGEDAEAVMQMEERNYKNYLADYVKIFGREKVVALIQGQINSIDSIKRCVHIDGEGVTYNSIVWKEESK